MTTTKPPVLPDNLALGPLTTTFTAPASCDTASVYSVDGLNAGFYQQGPYETNSGCLPSKWVLNGAYSPGVCPKGYTVACSATDESAETTVCCPTLQEFKCASEISYNRFGCVSGFTPTITLTNVIGKGNAASQTWPQVVGTNGAIWAYSVQVRNAVSTSTSSTTLSSSPSNSSEVLSGGAIAGIVIGAIVALALVGVAVFLLIRLRKHTYEVPRDQEYENLTKPPAYYSGYAEETSSQWHVPPQELEEQRPPAQLHGSETGPRTYELGGEDASRRALAGY